MCVHFFAHSKETNQRKGALQLGLKALLAKTINTAAITNSYPPAGLRHVITFFRVYELRSAALQWVLTQLICHCEEV